MEVALEQGRADPALQFGKRHRGTDQPFERRAASDRETSWIAESFREGYRDESSSRRVCREPPTIVPDQIAGEGGDLRSETT